MTQEIKIILFGNKLVKLTWFVIIQSYNDKNIRYVILFIHISTKVSYTNSATNSANIKINIRIDYYN